MTVSPLVRAALFVSDLERSRAFYEALGFTEVYFEGPLDQASTAAALHVSASTVARCAILKTPGQPNFGMVGLFELTRPAPPALHRSASGPSLGEVALVVYTDDLAGLLSRAGELGAKEVWDPITFVMPHRRQQETCLRDPDGVLVNVIGRPPMEVLRTESAVEIARSLVV